MEEMPTCADSLSIIAFYSASGNGIEGLHSQNGAC